MVVDAHCRQGVAIVPAVVGEGEDFAIRGCTEFCFYSLFSPASSLSAQAPLEANVGGYVSVLRKRNDISPSVFGGLYPKRFPDALSGQSSSSGRCLDTCAQVVGVRGCERLFAQLDLGGCLRDGVEVLPGGRLGVGYLIGPSTHTKQGRGITSQPLCADLVATADNSGSQRVEKKGFRIHKPGGQKFSF